jgi:hypothetical protein
MRCVGSSPAAAASALTNRLGGMAEEGSIEPVVFDAEDGLLDESDIEPATAIEDREEQAALQQLIAAAHALDGKREADPKVRTLIAELAPLLKRGVNPVIFCRFIATATALGDVLRKTWPKFEVAVVTGTLTPDERRERVAALEAHDNRILVATDCLSEGINLQSLFDTVFHYDLSWNPTRHQQREGRVDRFGQQAEVVRSVMMYGENSAIDGAVLNVIIRKAAEIQKATGVSVPMPEDQDSVTAALMQAVLLRKGGARTQMKFDFGASAERFETKWRDSAEGAKASRARYAQGALKPDEVVPEWRRMRALNGGPEEVSRFTDRALRRVRAPLEKSGNHNLVHLDSLPDAKLAAQTGLEAATCQPAIAEMLALMGRREDERGGTSSRAFLVFKLHRFISGAGQAYVTLKTASDRRVCLEGQKYHPEEPNSRLYSRARAGARATGGARSGWLDRLAHPDSPETRREANDGAHLGPIAPRAPSGRRWQPAAPSQPTTR